MVIPHVKGIGTPFQEPNVALPGITKSSVVHFDSVLCIDKELRAEVSHESVPLLRDWRASCNCQVSWHGSLTILDLLYLIIFTLLNSSSHNISLHKTSATLRDFLYTGKDMSGIEHSPLMSHNCTLEDLEPELQRDIMLEATTPSQVFNLIKASPRLYHVFALNKQFILSTVARRQFHPAVLSEALTFAKIPQSRQSRQQRSRMSAMQSTMQYTMQIAMLFCEINPSKIHDWQTTISPISESVALCKLAGNLKFFIEDYTRNTLPIMRLLGESPCPADDPSFSLEAEYWPETPVLYSELSKTEIGRLQRAFCRFEIYRELFARCSTELDHDVEVCPSEAAVSAAEQASLYLGKLPDYQIAEIHCIRDYLIRRLCGICTQLEDEAVETLSPETLTFDEDGDAETDQWSSGLFLFTEDGKSAQGDHFEHLISLGLPYIRRIFESTGDERRALFIRDTGHCLIRHLGADDFLTQALECLGRNPAWVDSRSSAKTELPSLLEPRPEIELDITPSWRWANTLGPPIKLSDGRFKGLRDWGYVFWDYDRLQTSGILERDSNQVMLNEFDESGVTRGSSVQERLLKPLSIWYLGADWKSASEPWEDWTEDL